MQTVCSHRINLKTQTKQILSFESFHFLLIFHSYSIVLKRKRFSMRMTFDDGRWCYETGGIHEWYFYSDFQTELKIFTSFMEKYNEIEKHCVISDANDFKIHYCQFSSQISIKGSYFCPRNNFLWMETINFNWRLVISLNKSAI